MWFDSWSELVRVALVGTAGYLMLLGVLRVSGKRTLSQLNIFDFVVTVALGSVLASLLLSGDVSWADGAVAFIMLAALQWVVAFLSSRWPRIRGVVTSESMLLLADGVILAHALKRSRLTESEVHQAIRQSGHGSTGGVKAVVLETNGKLSVIAASNYGDGSALEGLRR